MANNDNDDEGVAFQSSAFSVVSSWLLGGRRAADAKEDDEGDANAAAGGRARAPVTLYRPSASAKPSLTGRPSAGGVGNAATDADGRPVTEQEKELRKKLLRKSGSYAAAQAAESESAARAQQQAEQDKEEQALIESRTKRAGTSDVSEAADATAAAADPATAAATDTNPKKRKLNAQEELLETLRQDAARAKAKNQKAKQRAQRKKEQERQKKLAAAGGS
ncbi:hypothetical protein PybrP1_009490 [[Pythium] brassicae (nom. inval.)]|nr:hypothetical protein PybrP1_009490 [[Pythium] brassicae (nom. inval.)]